MLTEAICHYWAAPGRETDAALAWAWDLTWWMKRGVGEQPAVRANIVRSVVPAGDHYRAVPLGLILNFWADTARIPDPGQLVIYEVRGLMTTTHPGDRQPLTIFDFGHAWSLDYSLDPDRQNILRQLTGPRWDGR